MNAIEWLATWYEYHVNGDWEHEYGFKISTIDNPGLSIVVDLEGTTLENLNTQQICETIDEDDWYSFVVENKQFIGYGDPNKLEFLIRSFKQIVYDNGGYRFVKSLSDIISKYVRYGGFMSDRSVSVPFRVVHKCINELLENKLIIEKVEVNQFKDYKVDTIATFETLSEVREINGEDYYYTIYSYEKNNGS